MSPQNGADVSAWYRLVTADTPDDEPRQGVHLGTNKLPPLPSLPVKVADNNSVNTDPVICSPKSQTIEDDRGLPPHLGTRSAARGGFTERLTIEECYGPLDDAACCKDKYLAYHAGHLLVRHIIYHNAGSCRVHWTYSTIRTILPPLGTDPTLQPTWE